MCYVAYDDNKTIWAVGETKCDALANAWAWADLPDVPQPPPLTALKTVRAEPRLIEAVERYGGAYLPAWYIDNDVAKYGFPPGFAYFIAEYHPWQVGYDYDDMCATVCCLCALTYAEKHPERQIEPVEAADPYYFCGGCGADFDHPHTHDEYCNCQDCCYARGGEICATCGCIVGQGCGQDH